MPIQKNSVVSFHYRLGRVGGEFIEQTDNHQPAMYLHGHGNILPAMEKAFEGREAGETFSLDLTADEAYGQPDPNRQGRVPIKHLLNAPKKLRPGMQVQINTGQGPVDARVLKVGKFNVDVDANHPLAGTDLSFDIEIVEVRDATEEELSHGHAHGPGGHQH